jgi:hypothetical protein
VKCELATFVVGFQGEQKLINFPPRRLTKIKRQFRPSGAVHRGPVTVHHGFALLSAAEKAKPLFNSHLLGKPAMRYPVNKTPSSRGHALPGEFSFEVHL